MILKADLLSRSAMDFATWYMQNLLPTGGALDLDVDCSTLLMTLAVVSSLIYSHGLCALKADKYICMEILCNSC